MIISYTICSANYLAHAKAMGDSLVENNSHHKFVIILLDEYADLNQNFFTPHTIIPVSQMNIAGFTEMNVKYTIFELSCALKPFSAEYIFQKYTACKKLFYFDADIFVFGSLHEAEAILNTNSILLTPHFCRAINSRNRSYIERTVLKAGIYNGGFFGLRRNNETDEFLVWWKKRLEIFCFNDTINGLFVDQVWLNLAPLLFKSHHIFYNPGYNAAYWNLDERLFTTVNNETFVNDRFPLVFYHFSGYDFSNENIISNFFPEYILENYKILAPLFSRYKQTVLSNNYDNFSNLKSNFGKKAEKKSIIKINKFFGVRKRDLKSEDYKIK